jgi:hydroxypyruvate reductase/glycerate 2-kinase
MALRDDHLDDIRAIWDAAVEAAQPQRLTFVAVLDKLREVEQSARRVFVVGGGKAGAGMAAGLEDGLQTLLDRIEGLVNVPQGSERPLRKIKLQAARPSGSNYPTVEGVAGCEQMLKLLASAGPSDVAICLLSGGGSALLPAPVVGVTLEHKQATTKLLHSSGASINEMNAVRKHLSCVKGGGFARAFRGKALFSFIISDVVGDPLDVIASGPTAPDPTTFADAINVLRHYDLLQKVPRAVREYIESGVAGRVQETLKEPIPNVENLIIGSNARSLQAATSLAECRGYKVLNLGSFVEGETREVAIACAGIVRSIVRDESPLAPPCCILIGGETTVTLGSNPGMGGRNTEFVLAMLHKLGPDGMKDVTILSAGTDGEDGPTDTAGAIADSETLAAAAQLGLNPADYLQRHDSHNFFDRAGGLMRTGLTGTNVMDVRVILIN